LPKVGFPRLDVPGAPLFGLSPLAQLDFPLTTPTNRQRYLACQRHPDLSVAEYRPVATLYDQHKLL